MSHGYNTILTGYVPELVPVPQDVNITVSNELGSFTFGPFHIKGTGLYVEGDTNIYGQLHVHDQSATIDGCLNITTGCIEVHSGDVNLQSGNYYLDGFPLEKQITNTIRPNVMKSGLVLNLDATDINSRIGTLGMGQIERDEDTPSWKDLSFEKNPMF